MPPMAYLLGAVRGLDACSSPGGTFTVLALDHRQNLRKELRPSAPDTVTDAEMVDFKRAVVRALGTTGTGVLLDPEIGVGAGDRGRVAPRPRRADRRDRGDRVRGSGRGARQPRAPGLGRREGQAPRGVGGQAPRLLPPGRAERRRPGAVRRRRRRRPAASTISRCSWSRSRSASTAPSCTGEDRRRVVVETARRLTAIGADILKAEFPYDPGVTDEGRWREACAELDAATPVPWVLLSGGVDDATFERQVRVAGEAGASGVLVGRSVWAEAATMAPAERDAFLATEGRARLRRLAELVDEVAAPWRPRWAAAKHARRAGVRLVRALLTCGRPARGRRP